MEERPGILETLIDTIEQYSKTSIELFKLRAIELITSIISSIIARITAVIIFLIAIFLISFGSAVWLGEVFGKPWVGFFLVAAFYLLAGIIFYFILHKWLKTQIDDFIVKQIFK